MNQKPLPSLYACLILDAIGCLSYVIPFLGEFSDVVWAPVSGIIFYFMFGRRLGVIGGIVEFLEEISPGLDFIPTFTIGWWLRKKNYL